MRPSVSGAASWNWEQTTFLRLAGDSLVLIRGCCGIDTVPMRDGQAMAVINGRERRVSRVVGWAAMGAAVGGLLGSRKVERSKRIYPLDGAALMVVPKGGGRVGISLGLRL